ncbi:MAG: tRNA epoxyqueuosine(34) reductase QueG [Deltaproteobacteria bacterium]
MNLTLEDELRARGASLGFHRVGVAAATPLREDFDRYRAFIAAGFHGTMDYLADAPEVRARIDTPYLLEGAQSVIVCALAYNRPDVDGEVQGPAGATIARYARGGDYHNFFRKRIRSLASWLRARVPGSLARPVVDTAPLLERAWARRAGVGFIGKNGLVIVPGLGSYFILGEVLTTVALAPDEPMASRCGECVRCLDACPTQAFPAPFVLDPRRCISYLTIELREEIPEPLRAGVGDRLFGCDVCQEVCPYNRTAPPDPRGTVQFAPRASWRDVDLASLVTLDETRFGALTRGSPLSRPMRAGLARNAMVVMANSRERRYLPVLREAATHDPDGVVRSTAAWAIETIETDG